MKIKIQKVYFTVLIIILGIILLVPPWDLKKERDSELIISEFKGWGFWNWGLFQAGVLGRSKKNGVYTETKITVEYQLRWDIFCAEIGIWVVLFFISLKLGFIKLKENKRVKEIDRKGTNYRNEEIECRKSK